MAEYIGDELYACQQAGRHVPERAEYHSDFECPFFQEGQEDEYFFAVLVPNEPPEGDPPPELVSDDTPVNDYYHV